jgi:hypothetical protein
LYFPHLDAPAWKRSLSEAALALESITSFSLGAPLEFCDEPVSRLKNSSLVWELSSL